MKKIMISLLVSCSIALNTSYGNVVMSTHVRKSASERFTSSFMVSGVVVSTVSGLKPLDRVMGGDELFCYDQKSIQNGLKRVTKVVVREATADELLSIQIAGEASILGVTTGARFYARSGDQPNSHGDWTPADKLKAGDEIFTASGTWATVQSIGHATAGRTVFGLELEDNAPFYAGPRSLLVQGSE